jgi:hypothetical protein
LSIEVKRTVSHKKVTPKSFKRLNSSPYKIFSRFSAAAVIEKGGAKTGRGTSTTETPITHHLPTPTVRLTSIDHPQI